MKVHLLLVHYRESYEGEHAPNVMLAADEYLTDDNPSWWPENVAKEKAKVGSEAAAWAEIVVEVDTQAMLAALYPQAATITAPVVEKTPLPGLLLAGYDPSVHDPAIGRNSRVSFPDADEQTVVGVVGSLSPTGYKVHVIDGVSGVDGLDSRWVDVEASEVTLLPPFGTPAQ